MNNSPMNHGKILSNFGVQGSMVVRHSTQMAAPSFTVLAGLSVQSSATSPDHHSLPSSDIGEVDLDLWDLDINAPSVISNSSGGLSPAVPPGRRSSSTSSTSGQIPQHVPQIFDNKSENSIFQLYDQSLSASNWNATLSLTYQTCIKIAFAITRTYALDVEVHCILFAILESFIGYCLYKIESELESYLLEEFWNDS